MRKPACLLFALFFALAPLIRAADTPPAPMAPTSAVKAAPYFDPATIDPTKLLSGPPAIGSDTTKQEIALILQKQAARTPEEVTRIKREADHLNVWLFDTVLGSWYAEKNLPLTTKLFQRVGADEHPIIVSAKKYWNRPRPFLQDARVHPPITLPKDASYPSGHSTFGTVTALILAELVPDQKDALLARGQQIGDDRVIGGVHFPSDVAAGRTMGQAIFDKLMATPDFQTDLAKSKAEMAAVRANEAH